MYVFFPPVHSAGEVGLLLDANPDEKCDTDEKKKKKKRTAAFFILFVFLTRFSPGLQIETLKVL